MTTNPFRQIKTKCNTCGISGAMPNNRVCLECYELEKRLDDYLDTQNGLSNILSAIRNKGLAESCLGPLLVAALQSSLTTQQDYEEEYEEEYSEEDDDLDVESIENNSRVEETTDEEDDDWNLNL